MTTLAEHIIVARANNRLPMLEKSMYDLWASRIRLFIKGNKNGRMMLDSINNGSLVYPTVEENRQTRPKKYFKLTEAQQLQDDCDVQATNIILHGLPPNVYALVNHQEATKDVWDRVKLLMKGTELSYQERECRLYNLFDKFAYVQVTQQSQTEFPQLDSSLAVPTFQQGEHPIDCINKAMAFLSAMTSRGTATTLRRNYADGQAKTVKSKFPQLDSGLVVPTFQQGEDLINCINKAMAFLSTMSFAGIGNRGIASTLRGNYASGQEKVVKCYNYLGEGHMVKQCTQSKRSRSSAWFKEKLMLAEAQEAGQILDEEQIAFIVDLGIAEVQVAQQTIPQNSAFRLTT
ncbi:hypothetical protein Tco_1301924 [Tanacetum coccineum]